jgi:hypothetical protein
MRKWILAVVLLLTSGALYAYGIVGLKWAYPTTAVYTRVPGVSPSGIPWATAARQAAQEWNDETVFNFNIVEQYFDPCTSLLGSANGGGDGRNSMGFSDTICGTPYNSSTLAVTLYSSHSNGLNRDLNEADILFKSSVNYDVFDARPSGASASLIDFRRVALHELGHAIGLEHENSNQSIMRPTIGSIFSLTQDDINGVNELYSGFISCPYTTLDFGTVSNALSAGDCTVRQLAGGANDDSYVDVYELVLRQATTLNISMVAPSLDSVLLLTDSDSQILSINDGGAGGCNAALNQTLAAGTYVVLANTFRAETNCRIGGGKTTGTYELAVSYQTQAMPLLGRETSLLGGISSASFSGGVTINEGASFANTVSPNDAFDVVGSINIDPTHRNKTGFIVVAAIMEDGQLLLKNEQNEFLPIPPGVEAIPANIRKTLGAAEAVDILSNISAKQFGIKNIEIRFLVGYGLDSQPNEVYFHEEPISLVVRP